VRFNFIFFISLFQITRKPIRLAVWSFELLIGKKTEIQATFTVELSRENETERKTIEFRHRNEKCLVYRRVSSARIQQEKINMVYTHASHF
jgi:hypothetical protein